MIYPRYIYSSKNKKYVNNHFNEIIKEFNSIDYVSNSMKNIFNHIKKGLLLMQWKECLI